MGSSGGSDVVSPVGSAFCIITNARSIVSCKHPSSKYLILHHKHLDTENSVHQDTLRL